MKNSKTVRMSLLAMFIAIEVLLVVVPFLGFIPIGPIRATTLHIPVIIAGIVLGKKEGAFIGGVFGLSSLIYNTISPTVTSFIFSPFISGNLLSAVIAILPRILLGYGAGYLFEKLRSTKLPFDLNVIISSMVAALLHSCLVLAGIYLIFASEYANAISYSVNAIRDFLITLFLSQSLVEAIVGTIIVLVVSRALNHIIKKV